MKRIFLTIYILLSITAAGAFISLMPLTQNIFFGLELDEEREEFRGTFRLLADQLEMLPVEEWPKRIVELQEYFDFPVQLFKLEDIKVSSDYEDEIIEGNIVPEDKKVDILHKRIKDSDYAISIGPLPEIKSRKMIRMSFVALFIIIMAVPVFMWSLILWRDLKKVQGATDLLGEGDLSVRAEVSQISSLSGLASAFNSMAGRLENLIRSHRDLTNAVSHELRTPVARIKFELEMLKHARDDQAKERYISGMDRNISEIESLVDEMLTYAKFDREPEKGELNKHEIVSWLQGLVEIEHSSFINKTINFLTIPEMKKCIVRFEPVYMEWAVRNLIRNACRYSENRVDLILEVNHKYCRIHVDDDGPGIPEESRDTVFEPFVRLDTKRNEKSGGYGLGLAIVSRISKWHGGKAEISQSFLGGTRFSLQWPTDTYDDDNDSGPVVEETKGFMDG